MTPGIYQPGWALRAAWLGQVGEADMRRSWQVDKRDQLAVSGWERQSDSKLRFCVVDDDRMGSSLHWQYSCRVLFPIRRLVSLEEVSEKLKNWVNLFRSPCKPQHLASLMKWSRVDRSESTGFSSRVLTGCPCCRTARGPRLPWPRCILREGGRWGTRAVGFHRSQTDKLDLIAVKN